MDSRTKIILIGLGMYLLGTSKESIFGSGVLGVVMSFIIGCTFGFCSGRISNWVQEEKR